MPYDKKIVYLDYRDNGEKLSNVGFVKIELRDNRLRLNIHVRGVRNVPGSCGKIVLYSTDRRAEIGDICFTDGTGSFTGEFPVSEFFPYSILDIGIAYADVVGMRILLEDQKELQGTFKIHASERDRKPENRQNLTDRASIPCQEIKEKNPVKTEEISQSKKDQQKVIKEERDSDEVREESGQREQGDLHVASTQRVTGETGIFRLSEEKWQQLSAVYPKVRPFQDHRDYLSLSPSDFVIFTENSYRAANNSFLLHGYYNYKHLILNRVVKTGEVIYYLGVPGNYYEREKQVAVMFGFESFECAEEPAQNGDFGYYMMRVRL